MGNRADELARAAARCPTSGSPACPRCAHGPRFGGWLPRINVFKAPTLESRRALSQYWAATERHLRRWRIWRLNPFTLAWNGARDLKNAVVFFAAMAMEKYRQ